MVQLSELVAGFADDDECMTKLARTCGLSSPDEARPLYGTATGVVRRRLADQGTGAVATKLLLRSVRTVQNTGRSAPREQFDSGNMIGDEVLAQVFDDRIDSAVASLAEQAGVAEAKARGALEVVTAVYLSSAAELTGAEPTLEAVEQMLIDDGAGPGLGPVDAPAVASAGAGERVDAVASVTEAPEPDEPGSAPVPETADDGDGSNLKWLLAGVPVLLLAGGLVWFATSGDDSDDALAFSDESTTTVADDTEIAESDEPTDPAGDDAETPDATDETSGDDADESSADADTDNGNGNADADDDTDEDVSGGDEAVVGGPGPDSPAIPPGAPVRHAVVSGNQFFLRGYVESAEQGEQIVATMEPVFGEGNVINEYVIDAELAAQHPPGNTTVYIEDTILFPTGSAEVSPQFTAILDFGVRTLQLQPAITLGVTGHTDSLGSDADNLALSQRRVDSVKQYFIDAGIAPERVEAIGKGETEPVADNSTPEGRQANRRVEFLVNNFGIAGE